MKEIKAYVHRTHVGEVIAALKACPAWGGEDGHLRHNLALYVVKGMLSPLDLSEQRYSMELGDEAVNEYKLELLCEDAEVDGFINAIGTAARTGQAVGGWITVTDIVKSFAIR